MLKGQLNTPTRSHSGFSLVELSIVLVILGLLAAGVTAGKDLIRASEIRAVFTEYDEHVTAVYAFRDKYRALPGDMNNATSFWGVLGSGTCPTGTGTGTQTCNGNGDGYIVHTNPSEYSEPFLFWQHLANAGMVAGSYTGVAGAANGLEVNIGVNVPASKVSGSGWMIRYINYSGGGNTYSFTYNYENALNHGCKSAGGDGVACPNMTSEEAYTIDLKYDDGRPASGKIFGVSQWSCTDAVDEDDLTASYDLAYKDIGCQLRFPNIF